ncbi:MAG TPA: hypothetical protein VF749_22280, partial [Candidatus Acidoferrum sp.]
MSIPSFPPSARLGFALASCLAFSSFGIAGAVTKTKLRGYLTARAEANTVQILDDRIELTSASRVLSKDASGEHPFDARALSPGMLVEAEGQWLDKHRFFAEKLTVDSAEDEKKIHGSAYLQEEPADAAKIAAGEPSELKLDGYRLSLDSVTRRAWNAAEAGRGASANASGETETLAGYRVKYSGTRRKDGRIAAEEVELGPPAPADDYKMPHNLEIVRGKDAQTGI